MTYQSLAIGTFESVLSKWLRSLIVFPLSAIQNRSFNTTPSIPSKNQKLTFPTSTSVSLFCSLVQILMSVPHYKALEIKIVHSSLWFENVIVKLSSFKMHCDKCKWKFVFNEVHLLHWVVRFSSQRNYFTNATQMQQTRAQMAIRNEPQVFIKIISIVKKYLFPTFNLVRVYFFMSQH